MNIEKKVLQNISKCYSIAPLRYQGAEYILVASEKMDRCALFDIQGKEIETVFTEPGGVMTMVQVPDTDGQFLATHKFYSPNDSIQAKLVIVTPVEGVWEVRTLVRLPFVHRFDILHRNGINYLIACTLKSGHQYKEDWTSPGKVYAAVLPEDLSGYNEDNQLELTVIKEGLYRNHGYYRVEEGGIPTALISSENGIVQFIPPAGAGEHWTVKELLKVPASDAVLLDLDGDGERELGVIAPFHGDSFSIYKKQDEVFKKVYEHPEKLEFLHSIYGGELCKKPSIVVGYRRGDSKLISISYDKEEGDYRSTVIDSGCGSANIYHYVKDGRDIIISANREIDEIAMYTIT